MQMKLMLACALSHNARLLILDEPTSAWTRPPGMNFWTFSRNTSAMEKKAFSSPTHITADLERTADYITCLDRGKADLYGSMEGLLQKYYLIKGRPDELTPELQARLYGLRQNTGRLRGAHRSPGSCPLQRISAGSAHHRRHYHPHQQEVAI